MTSEALGYILEKLIADERVLDAYLTPIQMKKNRPGHLITVLCSSRDTEEIGQLLLTETTTFGLRSHQVERQILDRSFIQLETIYGVVRFKLGFLENRLVKVTPEYEDMRQLAMRSGVSFSTIYQTCIAKAEQYQRQAEGCDFQS